MVGEDSEQHAIAGWSKPSRKALLKDRAHKNRSPIQKQCLTERTLCRKFMEIKRSVLEVERFEHDKHLIFIINRHETDPSPAHTHKHTDKFLIKINRVGSW